MQDLEPTQADTKAGIMLRQSIELNSPYVYAYVNDSGIQIDYTQGGDPNNIAHISGSTATTPVYLRLERKEGSVYVYESDDGINFTLITTIVLSLSNPFTMGLASTTVNDTVTAQFNELQLQTEQKLEAKFTASVTSGEAPLTVTFDASASTGEGELTYEWRYCTESRESGGSNNIEYTFTKPGDYGCTLVVTDSSGESSSYRIVIYVGGEEPKTRLQLPFTIDERLVDRIYDFTSTERMLLESADTIGVYNYNIGRMTLITVWDNNTKIIGQDIVIPDIKESIHFSPKNTVLAEMYTDWDIGQWPEDHKGQLYSRFEQHPKFQYAVELASNIAVFDGENDEYILLTNEIVKDVARAYAIEQGWVDPVNKIILPHPGHPGNGSQNPGNGSTVQNSTTTPGSNTANQTIDGNNSGRTLGNNTVGILQYIGENNEFILHAKNLLAVRALVYEKNMYPRSYCQLVHLYLSLQLMEKF